MIDVWASWCAPCRSFAPTFAEAADEWGEWVGFGKLDAGHNPSLANTLGVRSIPTLLFFRDGRLVRSHVGVVSRAGLARTMRSVFRELP